MVSASWSWLPLSFLFFVHCVAAYDVPVSDTDYDRQICSGMWGAQSTYINVTFDSASQGQLALVVYEWGDMEYLGKITSTVNDLPKTYVCTSDAVRGGFCDNSQLGHFIVDLPEGTSLNQTSFWSARVAFPSTTGTSSSLEPTADGSAFWNDPAGNPTPPNGNYTSPWRRRGLSPRLSKNVGLNPSPAGTLTYTQPIQYLVRKTGYYCVAIVPVTVMPNSRRQAPTDVPYHPTYTGSVLFRNTFDGKLPATDYPKVNFYFAMFIVYAVLGAGWAWLCYRNLQDLLPIQHYLSSLLGFLIIEMVANWAYYRYLNAHGKGGPSTVFLIVVAILDAGRNALSFFLLLVVSLGLSVVRESLGRTMIKCQALAVAHFLFGVLYAVGIVELELEATSAFVLLIFVIPLAFTLSGFLLWILYSLNATILQLAARKQRYKLSMFTWLYRILLITVLVIAIFFVVSSLTFSGRLAEDYGAKSWKVQWWLLDGWLALLYLFDFVAIGYLWRPSPNNRRYMVSTLAMFDELAQDDEDAEDYDLEAIERRTDARGMLNDDDDTATLVGQHGGAVGEDAVVFDIGDEDAPELSDDDEATIAKKRRAQAEQHEGTEHEREGLMKDD
ncbi:lung seven transmembrane receptor-domain-containing protein [Amylocystis lapponica]|nr:lung seven transmembrane receptor-domain-containing protein [Amylocystis lapponica]